MPKRKKAAKKAKKPLDRFSTKSRRGRPGVRRSEVWGRGENFRIILGQIWKDLRRPLLKARTQEEVTQAFEDSGKRYSHQFVPALSSLILEVIREPRFPKRQAAQIGFLADSLAGLGRISPRRSGDICEQERKIQKKKHHIIRQDYYIECTSDIKVPHFTEDVPSVEQVKFLCHSHLLSLDLECFDFTPQLRNVTFVTLRERRDSIIDPCMPNIKCSDDRMVTEYPFNVESCQKSQNRLT